MSFWEHLEDLRWCIIKSLLAVVVGGILSYLYSDKLLEILIIPTNDLGIELNLQVLKVTSMFIIKLSISIMGGIILGLPVISYQFYKFISPAFQEVTNFSIIIVVFVAFIFFLMGLSFGFFILIPFSLNFFTSLTSGSVLVDYNFTLDGYLQYVIWLIFICGLVFQLPIVSYFLTKIGLLTPPFLRHYRKYAFVIFLLFGAILTPPDPISQILIVIPMILLYEFSIFISWIFRKEEI